MNGTFELVPSVPDSFAGLVADRLAAAGTDGATLFLSGGDTAIACYRALADRRVDWACVDAYWGDERCVPLEHPDSNHHLAWEHLFDVVGPPRSDHPMYRSGSAEAAAAAYQREVAALPALDVVHLGLGPDGHCASLFPGSATVAIDDPDVLVVADRDDSGAHPHDRVTLTLPAIARARLVVFTVAGTTKHDALARIDAGEDLPAARVEAAEVRWLVDADAAGDLAPRGG